MRYKSLIEPLQKAIASYPRKGRDWQYWHPLERAIKVIQGDTTFYRWTHERRKEKRCPAPQKLIHVLQEPSGLFRT